MLAPGMTNGRRQKGFCKRKGAFYGQKTMASSLSIYMVYSHQPLLLLLVAMVSIDTLLLRYITSCKGTLSAMPEFSA